MSSPKPLIDNSESGRIRLEIRHVLMDVWDPIGVKDEANAQDEYDAYIGRLFELLTTDGSDADLVEHLYWAAHGQMGFEAAQRSDMLSTVKALREINLRADGTSFP